MSASSHALIQRKPPTLPYLLSIYSRAQRHLDLELQFTPDIQHVSGSDNVVADTLSRISAVSEARNIDFKKMAVLQSRDPEFTELNDTSLQILRQPVRDHDSLKLISNGSTGTARPIVPKEMRKTVFLVLHSMSHPGRKTTLKLITERFVWLFIRKDVALWTKQCLHCQQSKVYRHVRSSVGRYHLATHRFDNIHLDIVGPLPSCKGFRYILTIVDRYTRWPEACSIASIDAETVATAFISTWISRYGVPSTIVTERGSQFTSRLWKLMTSHLGSTSLITTAYHPAANGLVERLHSQMKSVLQGNVNWVDRLFLCIFGLRTCYKDLQSLSADLVFGAPLKRPGDMVYTTGLQTHEHSSFLSALRNHFNEIHTRQIRAPVTNVFVMPDLFTVSHVFLRHDGHGRGLQYTYDEPYKVLRSSDKTFTILHSGQEEKRSLHRSLEARVPGE